MARLFNHFPPNSYAIFTSILEESQVEVDDMFRLSCPYVYSKIKTTHSQISSFRRDFGQWMEVPIIAYELNKTVNQLSIKHVLVSCNPFEKNYLLAAYFLHKIYGLPFSLYLWDMIDQGVRRNLYERFWTPFLERIAFSAASNIFVMSEFLHDHYYKKYKAHTIYMPHPVDIPCSILSEDIDNHNKNKPLNITFTGVVSQSQLDAMRNLSHVVRETSDVEFHIYTPTPRSVLPANDIVLEDGVFYHGLVPVEHVSRVQRGADILFLPMAFDVSDLQAHRAASPSKLGEYLASNRPILAHAPPYTYVAQYVTKHECGLLVDTPDLKELKKAVLSLKCDYALRKALVSKAKRAANNHDAVKVSASLQKALGLIE